MTSVCFTSTLIFQMNVKTIYVPSNLKPERTFPIKVKSSSLPLKFFAINSPIAFVRINQKFWTIFQTLGVLFLSCFLTFQSISVGKAIYKNLQFVLPPLHNNGEPSFKATALSSCFKDLNPTLWNGFGFGTDRSSKYLNPVELKYRQVWRLSLM